MLTFEEIERLILTGAGIQAFDRLHEAKKRILSAHLQRIKGLIERIEKKQKHVDKLVKQIAEINEDIKELNDAITLLEYSLTSDEAQKTVRATLIEDIFARKVLKDLKNVKKELERLERDVERLIEERPHYVYHMYVNTWSNDARESLRKMSRKRTLLDFAEADA